MNIEIKRYRAVNNDFRNLVAQLDEYLAVVDGEDHDFYHQYNSIEHFQNIVIAFDDANPIGCGAFKEVEDGTIEIKRMYVEPASRNKGIAQGILMDLEEWGALLGYSISVLETGKRQREAVSFYEKCGYQLIPNYGQYVGIENSVCFKKQL